MHKNISSINFLPFLVTIQFLLVANFSTSQETSFDCQQLLRKHQESSRFIRRNSIKSENYFFEAYCGCLQSINDTTQLNKVKKYYTISTFTGGLAMAKTHWYSSIIDSTFHEIYKTDDLSAEYIGFGYHTIKTYEYQTLYNQNGQAILTPRKYTSIKTIQSYKTGMIYFVGQTGLICDLFSVDGSIVKTWSSASKNEVLSSSLLLIYSYQTQTNDERILDDKIAIYNADVEELVPSSPAKLHMPEQWYIITTQQKTVYILDTKGKLVHKKEGVSYRDSKSDFALLAKQVGKNYYYDNEKNTFDTLVRNDALLTYGITVSVHPTYDWMFVLRDGNKKSLFTQPVKSIEHLRDEWFLISDGTSYFLNAKTLKKHPHPNNFAEAVQLSKTYADSVDFTAYPFYYKVVGDNDSLDRIQSKYLQIYRSLKFDSSGKEKGTKQEVYKYKFSNAHIVVENGYCKNYNQLNQLVDSFPADFVFELHRNNIPLLKDVSDLIPFGYSIKGKKGVFYLGRSHRLAPKYDALSVDENRIFSFSVSIDNKSGVIGTNGATIVPLIYTDLSYMDNAVVQANQRTEVQDSINQVNNNVKVVNNVASYYSLTGNFDPTHDATNYFIPSITKFRIIKVTENNGIWIVDTDGGKQEKTTFINFIPVKNIGYVCRNQTNNMSQLLDHDLNAILPGSFFQYCVLPSGIVFSGYTTNNLDYTNMFYSFSDKSLKPISVDPKIDEVFACQMIGSENENPVLIDQNGTIRKLDSALVYEDAKRPGYLFYALKTSPEKWGLMHANGKKITTPLFDNVFGFEGDHAVVWKARNRFYLDEKGNIFPF